MKEVGLRLTWDSNNNYTFYQDDSMRLNKRPGMVIGTSNPGN